MCSIWLWDLPASRCAGAGILNIFLCIHSDFDASLFAPKNATNLSPLSFLSLSIVCDSQRPPIPATYFKFRLGLTNHHISLRSKRFLLVSEQRKTEVQDFRFWPRENGLTIRINGNSQVALFFAILLLRLCFFVLLLLIPSLLWKFLRSTEKWNPNPPCSFTLAVFHSRSSFFATKPHRNAYYAGYHHMRIRAFIRFRPVLSCRPPCYYH